MTLIYQIELIVDKFRHDIKVLEAYIDDIRKAIKRLNDELEELDEYVKNGGSIAVEPKREVSEDGRISIAMGMTDTPQGREVLAFALNNRMQETKKYINLSLTMSFTYLLTVFDAKYMDVMKIYFNAISSTFPADVTVEGKLMKFAYKSFRKQITSLKVNAKIDFNTILSTSEIDQLVEIRETRNIIVHNSGLVNQKYLENVERSEFAEGDYRFIDENYLEKSKDLLQYFFSEMASQLSAKIF